MLTGTTVARITSRIKRELADKESLLRRQLMIISDMIETEPAADELDRAQWSTTIQNEEAIINNLCLQVSCLQKALQNINAGIYGLCEDCGRVIPSERLEAYPAATRCLSCEEKLTKTVGRRERKWKRS